MASFCLPLQTPLSAARLTFYFLAIFNLFQFPEVCVIFALVFPSEKNTTPFLAKSSIMVYTFLMKSIAGTH